MVVFFIGIESKQNPDVVLVDYVVQPFYNENNAVYYGMDHEKEIIDKYIEYEQNGISPHVLHFHVHPKRAYFEAFSDNDYINYAAWSARCSSLKSYGILASPALDSNPNTGKVLPNQAMDNPYNNFNLNVIMAENGKVEPKRWYSADFYSCQSICYIKGNEIFEFGNYQRNFLTRKYKDQNQFDFQRADRIIRNYGNYTGSRKVITIGHNPFGKEIKDESIGYVDINGSLCIPRNGRFDFPHLPKTNIYQVSSTTQTR